VSAARCRRRGGGVDGCGCGGDGYVGLWVGGSRGGGGVDGDDGSGGDCAV